jgi:hypothetical protein
MAMKKTTPSRAVHSAEEDEYLTEEGMLEEMNEHLADEIHHRGFLMKSTSTSYSLDVVRLDEYPWARFNVRCSSCGWGAGVTLLTAGKAFVLTHSCGACVCCGYETMDGSIYCGETCLATSAKCQHTLMALEPPRSYSLW